MPELSTRGGLRATETELASTMGSNGFAGQGVGSVWIGMGPARMVSRMRRVGLGWSRAWFGPVSCQGVLFLCFPDARRDEERQREAAVVALLWRPETRQMRNGARASQPRPWQRKSNASAITKRE
ncbi:hypothetical protein JCM24511_06380 [Saitozyma sp. JCM 24511]|nr:hypothetical protein JCM24511_06380 [Saitozyma sp. JCM 24511]